MSPAHATAALAALAADAQPGHDARDRARLLLADYLAVASAGAAADSARTARAAVLSEPPAGGPAPVLGTGRGAAARDAALVNGIAAHSLELDDTHEPSSSHPGAVIWTALLSAAAVRPATTRQALDAAVVGYQVMASVGELLGPAELYAQGLHPTAVCGVFGAAAAVGRLAGMDARGVRQSFGIALSLAAGSVAYLSEGAWTKRFHSGSAAAGGLLAADLAEGGFTGPDDAIGDRNGLMRIYGGQRPAGRVDEVLDRAAGLPAAQETSVKFHPCCRYMHGVMDLLAAYRVRGGRIDGLTRIDCGVLSGGAGLVADPIERKRAVSNMVDAQFSMPFGAALALSRGQSRLADFEDARALAAELQPLMDLVVTHASPDLEVAYPQRWGADVTLAFADGQTATLRTAAFRGSPGWPVGPQEIAAKAAGLLGGERAGRLFATVDALSPGDPFGPAALAAAGWERA